MMKLFRPLLWIWACPGCLLSSFWLNAIGRDACLENRFEREACEYDRPRQPRGMDGPT